MRTILLLLFVFVTLYILFERFKLWNKMTFVLKITFVPANIINNSITSNALSLGFFRSPETRQSGLCIVLDAQRSTWKTTKSVMHRVFEILDENVGAMLIVRLDVFWDKQRVENCTKSRTDGEVRGRDESLLVT